MNSYGQIVRTYAGRYRFWIFTAIYLLLPLAFKPDDLTSEGA